MPSNPKHSNSHSPEDPHHKSFDDTDRFEKKYQKEERQHRKQRQSLDRSQYKKTDFGKQKKKHLEEELQEDVDTKIGLVVRIVSRGYIVSSEGEEFLSSIRGTLKEKVHEDKNLVTIGDYVRFTIKEKTGWISSVLPRKSALVRQDNLLKNKKQFIAANVDQVFICSSIVDPPLKPNLIDRYIIAAKKGNIEPIVVVNKMDRLDESEYEKEQFDEIKRGYALAEIPLIAVSSLEMSGIEALKMSMEGKISVFSGQSGVGKSSLINALLGTDLLVGKTTKLKKGSHTTTHPILIPIEPSGFVIDTPGIKSFSIWDLSLDSLDEYFSEFRKYKGGCRFRDCTHTHEAECNIIKKVEEGKISPLRYESYLSLLNEESPKRR